MSKIRLALIILFAMTLAGCGKSASTRLIGKWKYDVAKALGNTMKDFGSSDIIGATGVKMEMSIEFKSDQTGNFNIPFTYTGPFTWKTLEEQGDKLTIEIINPKEEKPSKVQISFTDNDHMQFSPPNMSVKSIEFERVK